MTSRFERSRELTNHIYAPWTPEQEAQAIRWRKRGMTYAEVAQQMNVSKTIAENRLKKILARNPGILDKDTSSSANVAQPRRVINSTTTDLYVSDMSAPARPGAMDYKAIKSVGI